MTFEGHFFDLLTVITLRAQLTRDLLAIAKYFVQYSTESASQIQEKYYADTVECVNIGCILLVRVPGVE